MQHASKLIAYGYDILIFNVLVFIFLFFERCLQLSAIPLGVIYNLMFNY